MIPSVDSALSTQTAVRVALTASLLSLFLSGWTFLTGLDDAAHERRLEARLACLELPGPNDCGLDSR